MRAGNGTGVNWREESCVYWDMRWLALGCAAITMACAVSSNMDASAEEALTDCGTPPGKDGSFRHTRSRAIAKLGEPTHRGVDVVARTTDGTQRLGGKLAYGSTDKDLEDEDVTIFACTPSGWHAMTTTTTDDEGRFEATLAGAARLGAGTHTLYARVNGDGTGAFFYGFVLTPGQRVIVSDVDGTLTASENAIVEQVALGTNIGIQEGSPEALRESGALIVYLTARGDQFTELTRQWLDARGYPRGALRLAPSLLTLPGDGQLEAKQALLADLQIPIAAGIGNRSTDIHAYTHAGLTPDRIFIKLPEFTDELEAQLAAGQATSFEDYSLLAAQLP